MIVEDGQHSNADTRACGDCSLCCKLLGISELEKPPGEWCHHAKPGCGGCAIYEDRPPTCRLFECGWRVNPQFDDRWRPQRSKIVVNMNVDQEPHVLQFYVDGSRRDAWKKEPYSSGIATLAKNGRNGVNGEFYKTEVHLFGPREVIAL